MCMPHAISKWHVAPCLTKELFFGASSFGSNMPRLKRSCPLPHLYFYPT